VVHMRLSALVLVVVVLSCGSSQMPDRDADADGTSGDIAARDLFLQDSFPDFSGDLGDGPDEGSFVPDVVDVAPNVIERQDPGGSWPCADPATCIEDYLTFLKKAPYSGKGWSEETIAQMLADIDAGNVPQTDTLLSSEELARTITEALTIGFLLDGLASRELTVTTIRESAFPDHVEKHLLFEDPWVGTFEALFLLPHGPGPFPAVLALHGHGDSAAVFRDDYHGNEYPARGFAILMLTFRAMGNGLASLTEYDVTVRFMKKGYALMGMRVYEALLGLKFLRHSSLVDTDRVGLVGHSGGSSAGNLVLRVDRGLQAYVSDHHVDWAEWEPTFRIVHCETVPHLYPYSEQINDFSTSVTPVLSVDYGYPNGVGELFDFFDQELSNAHSDGGQPARR